MARRSFLRGCGGSAALLLPLLRNIEARAAGLAAPLRFLVIHHPLGTQIDKWRPAGVNATTTTFTLPVSSAPFAPLQSKMVMIDGLHIVTANRATGTYSGANTHEGGMVALMTGQPTLGQIGQQDHVAGGASIDQIFLARSPLLGGPSSAKRTPFGSLQLAADIRSDRDEIAPRVLSYLDPVPGQTDLNNARQPLKPETQPLNVFSRIFGAGMPSADVARYIAQKKSVLDFMRADLARLRAIVPAAETVKLDAQGEAIRQLESSIQASMGAAGGACVRPDMPPSFVQTGTGASGGQAPAGGSQLSGLDYYVPNLPNDPANPDNHPHWKLGMLQLDMIRAAFACDLVRVATFMWSAGTNWVVFPGTFNGQAIMGAPQSSPHHPPSHTTDASTMAWLAQIDAWYAQRTSEAIQAFQSMSDLDGNNLLDNTVIAYVSEVGRAYDHDQRNVPYLLFGGKNTLIQCGQFMKITSGPQLGLDGMMSNRPTNDVWLSLAPIFGINDMTSLGDRTQWSGPLPGLLNS